MRVLAYDPSTDCFFVDATWDEYRLAAAKYKIDTGDAGIEEVIAVQKEYQEDQKEQWEKAGGSFQQYLQALYGIDDMPSVCLGVKRDLSDLWVDLYDYPFGHMWNGYSPWIKIGPAVIHDLTDLAALECAEKSPKENGPAVCHGREEKGPGRHTIEDLLRSSLETMEKNRAPYNLLWSRKELTTQKLGAFCEHYAKMTLISYGVNVYTSEIDDHGIDFVAEGRNGFLKFQVKSTRASSQYIFMTKDYFNIEDDAMFLFLILLADGEHPDMYIIPTSAWRQKSTVFVSHDYEGKKSKPDYGVNISKKNMPELQKYRIENMLSLF